MSDEKNAYPILFMKYQDSDTYFPVRSFPDDAEGFFVIGLPFGDHHSDSELTWHDITQSYSFTGGNPDYFVFVREDSAFRLLESYGLGIVKYYRPDPIGNGS